jgi:hypothetical protein
MIKHTTQRSLMGRATLGAVCLLLAGNVTAQTMAEGNPGPPAQIPDTTPVFKPHGSLWGCVFGDYAYKGNSDLANRGLTQYSGMPASTSEFQFRRIYLGYDYEISQHFNATFLLSSENDYATGTLGSPNQGDLLQNSKFSPFVKQAYLRWKNIWKNSDLVIGQQNTPAYGIIGRNNQTAEEVWGYRSVERTISDIAGTPCYDMGVSLQGWFDNKGNFGYDVMVGNGTGAKPETDQYKWFYGDVFAKFMDKKLVFDLYQDYERLNWGVFTKGPNGAWYHDRNMTKLFAAYTTKKLTVGFEGFRNTLMGDVKVTGKDNNFYYRTTNAMAYTVFVRGRILSDAAGNARLGFFARYDNFDPTGNVSSIIDEANTKSYTAATAAYDPTTKQQFILAGLDYTPIKNVHLMPNLWANTYNSAISQSAAHDLLNPAVSGIKGTDVVWRLTFYYIYGK